MWPYLDKHAYIVHTSDFAHLEIHKNHGDWHTEKIFLGMIKIVVLQSLQVSYVSIIHKKFCESPKLKQCMCGLYACFHKYGHM